MNNELSSFPPVFFRSVIESIPVVENTLTSDRRGMIVCDIYRLITACGYIFNK